MTQLIFHKGMLEDLSMTGVQYNTMSSLFFVTYITFGMFVSY